MGSKSGNQILYCTIWTLLDKNSENSHFSTLTRLDGSGRNYDISSERSALSLSWGFWNNTFNHYKRAFHGNFHIFEKKSIFSSSKYGLKNENRKFYKEFVLESSVCFAPRYIPIVPPPPLESTFPLLLPTYIPDFEIFKNRFKNFNFWSFFNMKLNFHFYFLKWFS